MIALACIALAAGLLGYVFWVRGDLEVGADKTRLAHLHERKEVVYDNLRDLNFEYKAGKFPLADYHAMRAQLETEAAALLADIERLERPAGDR